MPLPKRLSRTRMMRPCVTKNASLSVNPICACYLVISENLTIIYQHQNLSYASTKPDCQN
ncbi:unnamed protein product [Callosobruchus maculatus]|uniref:Uncharacterized protein n=1 Tax=Callosobruchus maculatus TaxID=64391 RepID=A0A653CTX6_CALMS|nr:unnamed protein product [Callosobruchus maculatus]